MCMGVRKIPGRVRDNFLWEPDDIWAMMGGDDDDAREADRAKLLCVSAKR